MKGEASADERVASAKSGSVKADEPQVSPSHKSIAGAMMSTTTIGFDINDAIFERMVIIIPYKAPEMV